MFDRENMPIPGEQYFVKIVGKTPFVLSKNCSGVLLPFGQVQAWDVERNQWLGPNTNKFFKYGWIHFTTN